MEDDLHRPQTEATTDDSSLSAERAVSEDYEIRLSDGVGVSKGVRRDIIRELDGRDWGIGYQAEIADAVGISEGHCSRAFDSLIDDGIVARQPLGDGSVYHLRCPYSEFAVPPDVTPHAAIDSEFDVYGHWEVLALSDDRITRTLVGASLYLAFFLVLAGLLSEFVNGGATLAFGNVFFDAAFILVFLMATMAFGRMLALKIGDALAALRERWGG